MCGPLQVEDLVVWYSPYLGFDLFSSFLDWCLFVWANGHAPACLSGDGRATCFDHLHRCPVDFLQRFPVGGHVQSPLPVYSALVWRHVHPVAPLSVLTCHSQLVLISEVI